MSDARITLSGIAPVHPDPAAQRAAALVVLGRYGRGLLTAVEAADVLGALGLLASQPGCRYSAIGRREPLPSGVRTPDPTHSPRVACRTTSPDADSCLAAPRIRGMGAQQGLPGPTPHRQTPSEETPT